MSSLLAIALPAAVPLWVHRLQQVPWEEIVQDTPRMAQVIAEHGDGLLYRTPKSREAFNALAKAVAVLSFLPGGVTAFGRHWESVHPEGSGRRGCESAEERLD